MERITTTMLENSVRHLNELLPGPMFVQVQGRNGGTGLDLILGGGCQSAIGTLVERVTGFVLLLHLPEDHTAATVDEAMSAAIGRLPQQLWRSLTWDQGSEMALHTKITIETGLPIYFCDPHSPWQRGTNENTVSLVVARLGWSGRLVPAA